MLNVFKKDLKFVEYSKICKAYCADLKIIKKEGEKINANRFALSQSQKF